MIAMPEVKYLDPGCVGGRRGSWPPSNIADAASGIFNELDDAQIIFTREEKPKKDEDTTRAEEENLIAPAKDDNDNHAKKKPERKISEPCCSCGRLQRPKEDKASISPEAESSMAKDSGLATGSDQEQQRQRQQQQQQNKLVAPDGNSAGTVASRGSGTGGGGANGGASGAMGIRKRRIASIFQHYYPEGQWGYVILLCAASVQALSHGVQLAFGVLGLVAIKLWRQDPVHIGKNQYGIFLLATGTLCKVHPETLLFLIR